MPKVRDVLKRLTEDGWVRVATRGGRRQHKHPNRLGRGTVAGHPNDEIPLGTWNSIQKQAGWREDPKP